MSVRKKLRVAVVGSATGRGAHGLAATIGEVLAKKQCILVSDERPGISQIVLERFQSIEIPTFVTFGDLDAVDLLVAIGAGDQASTDHIIVAVHAGIPLLIQRVSKGPHHDLLRDCPKSCSEENRVSCKLKVIASPALGIEFRNRLEETIEILTTRLNSKKARPSVNKYCQELVDLVAAY